MHPTQCFKSFYLPIYFVDQMGKIFKNNILKKACKVIYIYSCPVGVTSLYRVLNYRLNYK